MNCDVMHKDFGEEFTVEEGVAELISHVLCSKCIVVCDSEFEIIGGAKNHRAYKIMLAGENDPGEFLCQFFQHYSGENPQLFAFPIEAAINCARKFELWCHDARKIKKLDHVIADAEQQIAKLKGGDNYFLF